jgi:WD40 repeat protein
LGEEEVFLAGSAGNTFVLNRNSLQTLEQFQANMPTVFSSLYLAKIERLYTAGRDAHISSWHKDSEAERQALKRIPSHMSTVNHIIALNSELIASASKDKEIRIWTTDLQLLKVINAAKFGRHTNSVNRLAFLPAENMLLSASDDKSIVAWKLSLA